MNASRIQEFEALHMHQQFDQFDNMVLLITTPCLATRSSLSGFHHLTAISTGHSTRYDVRLVFPETRKKYRYVVIYSGFSAVNGHIDPYRYDCELGHRLRIT